LELDPKQPGALGNLARFYLSSRQDLPEALGLCRRLVDSQPTAASYDLLGWACYANGLTMKPAWPPRRPLNETRPTPFIASGINDFSRRHECAGDGCP